VEIRFPFHFIPEDFSIHGISPRRIVQGVGFWDWGFVHTMSSMNVLGQAQGDPRLNQTLIGTGLGLRINFMDTISGRFDIAWPVGNESSYGREPRLHVLFTMDEPTLQQYEAMLEDMMQNRIRRQLNIMTKKIPPDMIESYETALALQKEGRYEEAKELYVDVIARKNELMTEAQTVIEEAIKKEVMAKEYLNEANELYENGNYLQAKGLYSKILELKDTEE